MKYEPPKKIVVNWSDNTKSERIAIYVPYFYFKHWKINLN